MIEGVDACRTELIPESPQGTLTYGGREDSKLMIIFAASTIIPYYDYDKIMTELISSCSENKK
jgi:hypothetical protein